MGDFVQQRAFEGFDDTMVSRAPFQHEPLEHSASIRVVGLSPGDEYNDDFICQLRVVDLDESPGYKAVSYVWGQRETIKLIYYAMEIYFRFLKISTALQHLRFRCPASSRLLWADRYSTQTNHRLRLSMHTSLLNNVIWTRWCKDKRWKLHAGTTYGGTSYLYIAK